MNVAVLLEAFAYAGDGKMNVVFTAQCSTGQFIFGQVPLDFAAAATTMNTRILDRAKQVVAEAGVPGAATATYRLFSGAI